jgi:hypothetical protein
MTVNKLLWKILDKRRSLISAMEKLLGNSRISLEGDLSRTGICDLAEVTREETLILRRNTLWPKQDFVVLPLELDRVKEIISAVGGTIPKALHHIEIEKDGRLEPGVYDNFTPSTTFLGSA